MAASPQVMNSKLMDLRYRLQTTAQQEILTSSLASGVVVDATRPRWGLSHIRPDDEAPFDNPKKVK